VFHSTESIASLRNLGYAYEGLEHWAKSQEQMAQDSKRLINRLYAPSNQAHKRLMAREEVMTRYFATIAVNVTEFERPCSVEVYLDGARVGGLVVMMQPETGTIYGNLGLDDVVEAQGMRNLTVEQTIKKIQASLEVEIVKVCSHSSPVMPPTHLLIRRLSQRDGSLVPLDSVSGLDVGLEDVPVTPPAADDELPRYGAARQRSAGAHARSHGRNCRCRKGKTY
jgi:tyrosinase